MIELNELFTEKGFDMLNVDKENKTDNGEQYISYIEFSRGFRDKVIGMKDVAEKDLEGVYYAVLGGDVTQSIWLKVTVRPADSKANSENKTGKDGKEDFFKVVLH